MTIECAALCMELAFQALWLADYRQTQAILNSNGRYQEVNPLVRRYGAKRYFLVGAAGHAITSYVLPEPARRYFQAGSIVMQVGYVAHNYHIGIHVRF